MQLSHPHSHHAKKPSLYAFFNDDEAVAPSSPPHHSHHLPYPPAYEHHHENLLFSPARSPNNSPANIYSFLPPPSPESPWTLSPHSTPSPSLLYHCISALRRHEGTIFSVAVARGLVFTASESARIRAWRQPDCTERGYFKASSGEVRSIVAHGNTIFTSHKDLKVRIWKITAEPETFQAKKIAVLPKTRLFFGLLPGGSASRHRDCISCMAYNHTEGLLYTGSWDRTVRAWRISDNTCVDSFNAHEDRINDIAVNQNDGSVFTASNDGAVKIWRRVYGQTSHTLTMTLKFQYSPVNALGLITCGSSNTNGNNGGGGGCFLYSGSSDGFINFWEKEKISGRFNHGGFLQGHRFAVLCLVALEKLVFSGSEDTTIRVWRREEGSCFHECLAVIEAHQGPVKCLAASLEIDKVMVMGFLVYSAGLDQAFKVWRIKVLPEEKNRRELEPIDTKMKVSEYEMSPVLSPSWVERKIQGNITHFI
ncbi:hypothetical protein M569_03220 [Genlisea aurea]|uniref:Uncharacterized protein n=1 Tax=Genlisea aurea TaxID=192259 RepID=S8D2B6_9LAMI|nr:hypothetical protein M569_03220 [Genlisea aurea]